MAGYTGEQGSRSTQQGFGFDGVSGVVRPLVFPKELSVKGTGLSCIVERIAERHLIDRVTPYSRPSGALEEAEAAWGRIAAINPDYTQRIVRLQDSMKQARRGNAVAEASEFIDYASGTFEDVENDGTAAVLQDVVRVYALNVEEDAGIAEAIVEDDLKAAFPDLAGEDGGIERLPNVTPANIFQLIIEGKLNLPGSGIPYRAPREE